ncbi:hypothetical protein T439DRAFT_197228 [Meredithblackwellia eburnea MCA 4105]
MGHSAPPDTSKWHKVTISIPFPTTTDAELVKRVIEVDKPLRPKEVFRRILVKGSSLEVEHQATTVSQIRVVMDHCLADIQLIIQTMNKFAPLPQSSRPAVEEAPSLEVGLKGSWGGAN